MKKNIGLLSILSMLILSGCTLTGTPISSSNDKTSTNGSNSVENRPETKLIFTELMVGAGDNNRALELYNFSDEDVDLSKYTISHYKREMTPDSTITLSGTVKAKETYVIVTGSSDSEELRAKADYIANDLTFTGKGALTLNLDGFIVDTLGFISYYNDYAASATLVRKVDYMVPRAPLEEGGEAYDEYDWIRYGTDNYKYLGNVENSVTPEELLNGPCLEDKYLDLEQYPFYYNDGNSLRGGGGAVEASVKNNIDGDTSDFYISTVNPSDFMYDYYGTANGKNWIRARYFAVDTPESGGAAGIQEFGMMAKYYTAYIQNNAEKMYIQTVKDDSIVGQFGRLLSFVWADRDTLVNYETIKAGYSSTQIAWNEALTYKDLPYESYFRNATLYARKFKKGRYGEKDPYWNYTSHKSYCESISCGNYFENGGSILA